MKGDCERVANNSRATNGVVVLCSGSPPSPRALIRHSRGVLVVDVGLGHRWSWQVEGSIDRGLWAKILALLGLAKISESYRPFDSLSWRGIPGVMVLDVVATIRVLSDVPIAVCFNILSTTSREFLLKVRVNRLCAEMTKFGHASASLEDRVIHRIPTWRNVWRLKWMTRLGRAVPQKLM